MGTGDKVGPSPSRTPRWRKALAAALLVVVPVGAYLARRFTSDAPVDHADPVAHFKYGSTGGERASGIPYEIWQVLPTLCSDKLPGRGYESLGFLYEKGSDLPIGVSRRRVQGVERVFLNCAACHTSTVRDTEESEPRIVVGMPANRFDIRGWTRFLFDCAGDQRFTPQRVLAAIDQAGLRPDPINRLLYRYYAVDLLKKRLAYLRDALAFVAGEPEWGPGRVNTFAMAKALLGFRMDKLPEQERLGAADFPSIWNQRPRQGMQLHWDGNNRDVTERNKSAAFGTGTTPPTIDIARIRKTEDWLWDARPPAWPYGVDPVLAARGAPLYRKYCAGCHGASGQDFTGERVGTVTPIEEIGTDRRRLDSYTFDLAVNQNRLYAGYPWRFKSFRKTHGYANMPLDGLWLRAPYLHNGSVPTLRDLLEPVEKRPVAFHRGDDVYDRVKVGFRSDVAESGGRRHFPFDTRVAGNGNGGHAGPAYGTELPAADKDALVEHLKTF
jgi:mono/diheme cytochrome c family protein